MEQSWENYSWRLLMAMEMDLLELCHGADEEEEFLKDILQQPAFSAESESQSFVVQNNIAAAAAATATAITNEVAEAGKRLRPSSSSPRRYILSFDNAMMVPAATPEESFLGTTLENRSLQRKTRASQGGMKTRRSDSHSLDHIMAERKRRQELTQKFIALSATIPGLKKMDKTSIVEGAINHVKQLQERVMELEHRIKRGKEPIIILKKSANLCANTTIRTTSKTINPEDYCFRPSHELVLISDVKAKVLGNEVLIEINCEKENGIDLKILNLLQNLHLFVTGSSVLPFGNAFLVITIIAQMCDAYKMTTIDLVENIRKLLPNDLNSY